MQISTQERITLQVLRDDVDNMVVHLSGSWELHLTSRSRRNSALAILWVALKQIGVTNDAERERRLEFLSGVFGRQLTTAKQLNYCEVVALYRAMDDEVMRSDLERMWHKCL